MSRTQRHKSRYKLHYNIIRIMKISTFRYSKLTKTKHFSDHVALIILYHVCTDSVGIMACRDLNLKLYFEKKYKL